MVRRTIRLHGRMRASGSAGASMRDNRSSAACAPSARLCGRSRLSAATRHARGTVVAMEFEVIEQGAQEPCLRSIIELLYLGQPA